MRQRRMVSASNSLWAAVVYSRHALHQLPDFWKGMALERIACSSWSPPSPPRGPPKGPAGRQPSDVT